MDKYKGSGNRDHKNAKGGTDTAGDIENELLRDFLRFTGRKGGPRIKCHIVYLHRNEYPVSVTL